MICNLWAAILYSAFCLNKLNVMQSNQINAAALRSVTKSQIAPRSAKTTSAKNNKNNRHWKAEPESEEGKRDREKRMRARSPSNGIPACVCVLLLVLLLDRA